MPIKGKPNELYNDEYVAGYFNEYGELVIVQEYGTDEELGNHALDVIDGNGYYDSKGKFHYFKENIINEEI